MSPHASVYISVHGNVIFTFDQLYPFPYTYLFREREREWEISTNKQNSTWWIPPTSDVLLRIAFTYRFMNT